MGLPIEPKTRSQKYWERRTLDRSRSYFKKTEVHNKRMLKEFNKASKNIKRELQKNMLKYGFADGENNYTRSRLKTLYKQVDGVIDELYGKLGKNPRGLQLDVYDFLAEEYVDNFNRATFEQFKGFGMGWDFVQPDISSVKEAILEPYLGKNFSDRLYDHKRILSNTLRSELANQFITGSGYQDAAKVISKKVGTAYNAAVRLVRTESTKILNLTSTESYEELNITQEYQYVATLDSRTSDICQSLDGQVFKLKDAQVGVNLPPAHPNCRSTTVPWFENVVNLSTRIARASGGNVYKVPEDVSYKQWYNRYAVAA